MFENNNLQRVGAACLQQHQPEQADQPEVLSKEES